MQDFQKSLLATSISLVALSSGVSTSALAQDNGLTIEEVVVSAQMREQSLQEVPVSVSAFDSEFLDDRDINSFKKLFDYTPGVSGVTNDSFFDAVSVRGVTNNGFGSGSDPAVGVFLNGVYQSRSGAAPTFFDLSTVEVIKGPQGTLFGRNTASGAISAKTAKPGDEVAGMISADLNSESAQDFEGFVDLPVTDNLAMRFAAISQSEDGYVKNLAGGRDLGESDVEAYRFSLVYTPTDRTEVFFMAQDENRTSDGTIYRSMDTVGAYDEVENDQIGADNSGISDFNLTITHDLSESVTFESITGYKDHDYYYIEDFDGTADLIDTFARDQSGTLFSQEFRLTGTGDTFNWAIGASYYDEDLDADFLGMAHEDFVCTAALGIDYEYGDEYSTCTEWAAAYPEDFDDAFGTVSDPMDPDYDPFEYTDNESLEEWSYTSGQFTGWGLYGNVDINLSEQWVLGLGARYTVDEKTYTVDSPWPDSWTGTWNYLPYYTEGAISDSHEWDNLSGRMTLTYMPNDDLSFYVSAANGYKSGGYNYLDYNLAADYDEVDWEWTVDSSVATPAKFDEETVESYEIGVKSMLAGGRLQFNSAIFSYTYEGLQQNFYREGSGGYVTENVGQVDGTGLEGDLRWLATENLDLMLGFAWLDTDLQGAPDDLCEGCDGNAMPFSPEFSGYIMGTYTIDSVALTAEYIYNGEQEADLDNTDEIRLDAYGLLNLRASWTSASEAWQITVYGDNLTGEEFYRWGYAEDGWMLGATQTDPSRGAEYGAGVKYKF